MKSLVLRFDVDTYRCINEGVPNLLRLAREEQVKFVFSAIWAGLPPDWHCWEGSCAGGPRPQAKGEQKDSPASVKLGHYQSTADSIIRS